MCSMKCIAIFNDCGLFNLLYTASLCKWCITAPVKFPVYICININRFVWNKHSVLIMNLYSARVAQ